jgi:hypothetical protein
MKLPVQLIQRNLRRELEMARWRIYEKASLVFIDFRSFWQKVPDLNPFELRLKFKPRANCGVKQRRIAACRHIGVPISEDWPIEVRVCT